MPITIDGSGSISGLSAGGLPDLSVQTADLAASAVTTAKVADANITAAKLDGAQSGSAPIYGARAWVNFNGTGTVAIRASGNVSSVSDNGVGDYTVNFTTAIADANYGIAGCVEGGTQAVGLKLLSSAIGTAPTLKSTTQARLNVTSSASSLDANDVTVAVFR